MISSQCKYRTFRNHFLKYSIKKILQVNNITIHNTKSVFYSFLSHKINIKYKT